MKIATFVNENDEIVGFREKGTVCLYARENGVWVRKKSLPLTVGEDAGLPQLKRLLAEIAAELEGCTVFVVSELKGIYCLCLAELGFRIWKSEGPLFDQFDRVEEEDARRAAVQTQTPPAACGGPCDGSGERRRRGCCCGGV
jgi:Fe-only nitrogenase accessory protein AnfO